MRRLFVVLLLLSLSLFAGEKKVKLDSKAWSKLNVFLSNFSEAALPFFEGGYISNYELIKFGIHHNAINYPKEIKSNPKNETHSKKISKKAIYKAVDKYFGKKLTNKDDDKILIFSEVLGESENKQEFYFIPEKDSYLIPNVSVQIDPVTSPTGESYQFVQIIKMVELLNSNYKIIANVYSINLDSYDMPKKAINNLMFNIAVDKWTTEKPSINKKIEAIVKKDKSGLYKLINYKEIKENTDSEVKE